MIGSLVLCSVADVDRVLAEIARILVPGGQYLFLEHVRNPRPAAGMAQRVFDPVWRHLGGGCRLTRNVEGAIRGSPLTLHHLEVVRPGGILPVICGQALKGASSGL